MSLSREEMEDKYGREEDWEGLGEGYEEDTDED